MFVGSDELQECAMICLLLESETPLAKVLPMNSIARRWKLIAEKLFIVCLDARKTSRISDILP